MTRAAQIVWDFIIQAGLLMLEPMLIAALLIVIVSAALAIAAFLLAQARRRQAQMQRQLEALERISAVLSRASDLDQALAQTLDAILEFTHAAAARLWLMRGEEQELELHLHRGLFPETYGTAQRIKVGAQTAGRAAALGKPIREAPLDPSSPLRDQGFVETACVPLIAYNRTIGVLEVSARHSGELEPRTIEWLQAATHWMAGALADAEQLADARARETEVRRLMEASGDLALANDYAELLRTIVDRARELLGAEASAICLWDDEKRWWSVQGVSGAADAFEVTLKRFERQNGSSYQCPVLRFKYRRAHLDIPLLNNGRVVGCLCVANQEPRDFSEHERALLTGIAEHAARAVDHALEFEHAGQRAATAERERLAREMHDTLAQILGFVNIKTSLARDLLAEGKAQQASQQLEQLNLLSQELYADTRELILGLRSQTPDQRLVPCLKAYAERFEQFSSILTAVESDGLDELQFAPTVELQLVRVVQEALSNVRKHAKAERAIVRFVRQGEFVSIAIEDNGRGFDPGHVTRGLWPRFGLQSMRERVESIGGTFTVNSAPGRGTTIAVRVPLVYRGD